MRIFVAILKCTVAFASGAAYVFTDVRDNGWVEGILSGTRICLLNCTESFCVYKEVAPSPISHHKYNNYNVYLNMINWPGLLTLIHSIE